MLLCQISKLDGKLLCYLWIKYFVTMQVQKLILFAQRPVKVEINRKP